MSNIYVFFKESFLPVHSISSQTQANSNPGQVLMSYSKGLAGSSPKLASQEDLFQSKTAGKRRFTVGLIGIFRPANLLDLLGHYVIKIFCKSSKSAASTHPRVFHSR
jgi:hypothetical protein